MPRKAVVRLFFIPLIILAFYFVFIRNHPARISPSGRPESRMSGLSNDGSARPSLRRRNVRNRTGQRTPESDSGRQLTCSSQYFSAWEQPAEASCRLRSKGNYPIPDPRCTPGGINPSVSGNVLRDPRWRTRSVRNCESSEAQKHIAYRWYNVQMPRIDSNQNQVCELDHLVPLELGGADGRGNIWPQCGPDAVTLNERYFKRKDRVENYLAQEVKSGRMELGPAQRGIASDWTQYLPAANRWCQDSGRC